jgi:hypothetical protein
MSRKRLCTIHPVIQYFDENGRRRKATGATDKTVSERIANDLENKVALSKQGLIDPKAASFRDHEAKPLAYHLDAWHRDMLAKGKTTKHVDLSRDRAAKLIAMVKGVDRLTSMPCESTTCRYWSVQAGRSRKSSNWPDMPSPRR